MLDKIYNARFFDKQSGVEITIDDARVKGQKTTKDREVFVLYDDIDAEQFCMANGIVRKDYFHELLPFDEGLHISSKHYKIESIGTAENLKEQKAEKEIRFCVAFKKLS